MAFYSDLEILETFIHRGRTISIGRALKGALHCDIPHDLEDTECLVCGEPILSETVFQIVLDNKSIVSLDFQSIDDAREFAMLHLDDLHDLDSAVPDDVLDALARLDDDEDNENLEDRDTLPGPPPVPRRDVDNDDMLTWGRNPPPKERKPGPRLAAMLRLGYREEFITIFNKLGIK